MFSLRAPFLIPGNLKWSNPLAFLSLSGISEQCCFQALKSPVWIYQHEDFNLSLKLRADPHVPRQQDGVRQGGGALFFRLPHAPFPAPLQHCSAAWLSRSAQWARTKGTEANVCVADTQVQLSLWGAFQSDLTTTPTQVPPSSTIFRSLEAASLLLFQPGSLQCLILPGCLAQASHHLRFRNPTMAPAQLLAERSKWPPGTMPPCHTEAFCPYPSVRAIPTSLSLFITYTPNPKRHLRFSWGPFHVLPLGVAREGLVTSYNLNTCKEGFLKPSSHDLAGRAGVVGKPHLHKCSWSQILPSLKYTYICTYLFNGVIRTSPSCKHPNAWTLSNNTADKKKKEEEKKRPHVALGESTHSYLKSWQRNRSESDQASGYSYQFAGNTRDRGMCWTVLNVQPAKSRLWSALRGQIAQHTNCKKKKRMEREPVH